MNIGAFASVLALELAARNAIAIVGPGSSEVAVQIASLLGTHHTLIPSIYTKIKIPEQTEMKHKLISYNNLFDSALNLILIVVFKCLYFSGSLNYPLISYASTSSVLSNTDRFSMFARTVPSDVYQCRAIKDLILHYRWTYVSIIYSPHLYGAEGAAYIKRLLESEGKSYYY